jgi:hypothetical protein
MASRLQWLSTLLAGYTGHQGTASTAVNYSTYWLDTQQTRTRRLQLLSAYWLDVYGSACFLCYICRDQLPLHTPAYLFIYPPTYLFIYPPTYLFTYPPTYLPLFSPPCNFTTNQQSKPTRYLSVFRLLR